MQRMRHILWFRICLRLGAGIAFSAVFAWLAGPQKFLHHAPHPKIPEGHPMITAPVRYKLPPHIDYAACREHFHKIAPGFREAKGLISKHFIWSASGWAGGVYQWKTLG